MSHSIMNVQNDEIYKPYKGYIVSRFGEIISQKRKELTTLKEVVNPKTGYCKVGIYEDGKPCQYEYVHRIVARTFHGPVPEGKEVDHINRDKTDNRAENLRYITRRENMRNTDKWISGLQETEDMVKRRKEWKAMKSKECWRCEICEKDYKYFSKWTHIKTKKHLKNKEMFDLNSAINELVVV